MVIPELAKVKEDSLQDWIVCRRTRGGGLVFMPDIFMWAVVQAGQLIDARTFKNYMANGRLRIIP